MNRKEYFLGKHILSIDYGKRYTGLASYLVGTDPFPLCLKRIKYISDEKLMKEIKEVVDSEGIDVIVLGLPLLLDGKESKMTKTVKFFESALEKYITSCKLYLQDETLTTFEAKERMKNSPKYNFKIVPEEVDSLSAVIILEDFIHDKEDIV